MFCLFDLPPPPLYSNDNRDGGAWKSGQNGTCNGQANFTNGTLGKSKNTPEWQRVVVLLLFPATLPLPAPLLLCKDIVAGDFWVEQQKNSHSKII